LLLPFDSGDHAIWVGGPDEGFGIEVCFGDEAVDGDPQINEDRNTPRLRRWRVGLAKKPSTALSQDAEVVKRKFLLKTFAAYAVVVRCNKRPVFLLRCVLSHHA
jgi:hypothetical protein